MSSKPSLVIEDGRMRRLRVGETPDPASFLVEKNLQELAVNRASQEAAQENLGLTEFPDFLLLFENKLI